MECLSVRKAKVVTWKGLGWQEIQKFVLSYDKYTL